MRPMRRLLPQAVRLPSFTSTFIKSYFYFPTTTTVVGVSAPLRIIRQYQSQSQPQRFSPALTPQSGPALRRIASTPTVTVPALKRLNVELDGQFVSFDQLFLRDACSCPHCIHPSTQQKLFQTTDIPYDVRADFTETLSDGSLRVRWKNDIPIPGVEVHESIYTPDFLRRYSTLRNRVRARLNDQRQILWDRKKMESDVLYINYSDYMSSDEALFRAIKQLSLYGLMFIRGVPEGQHDAIEGMAERIGNLKNTFYGKTWDVKSVEESKNIA